MDLAALRRRYPMFTLALGRIVANARVTSPVLVLLSVCVFGGVTALACGSETGTPTSGTSAPLPAFPGAEGFGVETKGGRGGAILRVTNLNDSGPGSLREAASASGPRTVIFDVSGTITLTNWISIKSPFLTIAGQTAPSPGITLKGAGLSFETNDVVVQHLRIRVGDSTTGPWPGNRDGLQILGSKSYNIVLDHLSVSWSVDEIGSSWYAPVKNVTFSNCIFSEGLGYSIHPDGYHSKGVLIGQGSSNIAFIGNLFAHNAERHPRIKAGASVLLLNNVMYDIERTHVWVGDSTLQTAAPVYLSAVGNLFLAGPSSRGNVGVEVLSGRWSTGSKIYMSDNLAPSGTLYKNYAPLDPRVQTPPVWKNSLTVRKAADVEDWVTTNAGARPWDRDSVDRRIVAETLARTGRIIDSPAQVGGWPMLVSNRRTLALPADPNGDSDRDGYTNLEELLHSMSAQLTQ